MEKSKSNPQYKYILTLNIQSQILFKNTYYNVAKDIKEQQATYQATKRKGMITGEVNYMVK